MMGYAPTRRYLCPELIGYLYIYMQICIINMSFNQERMINDDTLGHSTISSVKFICWFQLPKNTRQCLSDLLDLRSGEGYHVRPGCMSACTGIQYPFQKQVSFVCNKWTTQTFLCLGSKKTILWFVLPEHARTWLYLKLRSSHISGEHHEKSRLSWFPHHFPRASTVRYVATRAAVPSWKSPSRPR